MDGQVKAPSSVKALVSALLAIFVVAIVALLAREYLSLRRLAVIDRLRTAAESVLETDVRDEGRAVLGELGRIYDGRADLAAARQALARDTGDMFDGAEMVRHAESVLLAPLDARMPPDAMSEPAGEDDDFASAPAPDDDLRARITSALGPTPVHVDDIIRHTGAPPAQVALVLLELELAGRLERHSGGAVSLLLIDP